MEEYIEILSKYPSLYYCIDNNNIMIIIADIHITVCRDTPFFEDKNKFNMLCERLDSFLQNLKIICGIFSKKLTGNIYYHSMRIHCDVDNIVKNIIIRYNNEIIERININCFNFNTNILTGIINIIKQKFPELTQRIDDLHIMHFID